jgi:DNA polymerase elongation subunit (family B)
MVNAGDILNYTKEDLEKLSKEELEKLYSECQYWEEFYNTQQMVEKIMINSLYGAQGNKDFILLNEKVAQAITGNGRFLVKNSANMIEDKLQKLKPYHNPASELSINSEKSIKTQYVIYGDTDSFYFTIDPFMQEVMQKRPNLSMNEYVDIADQFCTKICEPVVQDSIKIATTKFNARRPDVIGCKRECISDSCVYVAKKKYISRVRDSEGTRYPETQPHMKTMGVELARGSTAPYCKVKLTESIDIILDKDETYLRNWIEDVRKDFMKQNLLEISNYCGISSTKLKTLGTHFIAKSAYYYNQYIIKNKLESTYGLLQSGTKARIIQLKSPNPLNPEVKYLVYNDVKFAELMREYIDFDEAFNKHFIAPLNNMVKALDIDLTKRKINFDELNDW